MLHKIVKFIHNLRIFLFALILVSFLYNIGVDPVDIGRFLGAKIGHAIGIGTSTSVPPNPFNNAAVQLAQKEQILDERENYLNQKEKEIYVKRIREQQLLIYVLSAGIVVLFVLISVNFYLDIKRKKGKN